MTIYNRLVHEVTVINSALPPDRQLSYKERLQLVSSKYYPRYKDTPPYKLRIKQVRSYILNTLRRRAKKREACDILAVPASVYQEVPFYAVDELLSDTIPRCVFVKVSAGHFGETKIFNTRDYDYGSSGIKNITDNIHDYTDGKEIKSGDLPFYEGNIQLRPRKQNNGESENYYLELVLVIRGDKAKALPELTIPAPKGKKAKQKRKKAQIQIRKRITGLPMNKTKSKNFEKSITNEIKDTQKLLGKKLISKEFKADYLKKIYANELKRLKKALKNKVINQQKFDTLLRKVNKGYKR